MKYVITENRMIDIVEKLIQTNYPNFKKGKCHEEKLGNDGEMVVSYFNDKFYAEYNPLTKGLALRPDLYDTLENILGENNTMFAIDWFNREFNQDAEFLSYYKRS